MRVLLLYPEFPDTFWSFKHALRFIRKHASFPPLGLLTIAAMLPDDWDLRLVDLNVQRLREDDLRWADMAMVSAMVAQRESTVDVIDRCAKAGLTIVAGGPLFLGEYESFDRVDHFVLDEGECTLPRFLEDWAAGTAQRVYRADGYADLTQTPLPRWELADLTKYSDMCIQFSRGCPFDCEFCSITAMFGHRPRVKSTAQIVAELDSLHALGWHGSVFFVDDNFIGNKRVLKQEVLPALIEWRQGKKGFGFHTEVSVNLADDPELLQMMVDAGFEKVFVGIETPDDASLAECNKRQNEGRDLIETVRTLQQAGLEVQGGFIVGFDADTPSIFERQIQFIQRSGIVAAMVGLLQAPHGTRLYDRLQREGRLLDEFSGNNTDNTMNFEPQMDVDLLHEGYRRILTTIYAPKAYYQRVRTFLSAYEPPASVRHVLSREHIKAFLRSTIELGIKGKERFEYWKLIAWAAVRRPRVFSQAVTLAIYGFHFRRICERYAAGPSGA